MIYVEYIDYNTGDVTAVIAQFRKMLDEDTEIHELNLEAKHYELPQIQSRWLHYYVLISKEYENAQNLLSLEYNRIYRELKLGSNIKVDTTHFARFIEGDSEYIAKKVIVDYYKIVLKFVENAMKRVNDLSFIMENAFKIKQFMGTK